jgi:hypothetical protein
LQTIKKLLPQLRDDEAREVANLLKARLQFKAEAKPASERDDWLLRGIVVILRKRGLVGRDWWPNETLRKKLAPKYVEEAEQARAVLTAKLDATPGQLQVLGVMAADALATWLEERKAPVSIKTMLMNAGNLPEAFDASFPGYLESGLVGAILP